jgi:hypothetical protein
VKRIVLALLFCVTCVPSAFAESEKKLIHLGIDAPDIPSLPANIRQIETAPFDGWTFSVTSDSPRGKERRFDFSWEGWGTRSFTKAELQNSVDALKATKFEKFTDNFIRFCTTPADVDWFESDEAMLNNARLAAWIARQGGVKGVLFDTEQYKFPLFDYHKQKHASTKTYGEYAEQVRKRGSAVMRAFQEEYPDITILMLIGHWANYKYGYPNPSNPENHGKNAWNMWTNDPKKLEFFEYGLLSPFIDGMVEAAGSNVKLVDGFEMTYMHLRNQEFVKARRIFLEHTKPFMKDPHRYFDVFTQGFGIFLDAQWLLDIDGKVFDLPGDHTLEFIGWNKTDFTNNYWQPDEIQMSLTNALKHADKYVWLYSERTWYWGPNKTIPPAYEQAIRNARAAAGLPK